MVTGPSVSEPMDAESASLLAAAEAVEARDGIPHLLRIAVALSRAVTADEVLDVVLNELVEAVGADGAVTALLVDGDRRLRVQGSVGYRSEVVEALREFDVDAPLPLALAVRRRAGVAYPSRAAMVADNPGMEALVQPERDRAVGAWPLVVAGQTIGSVGLTWPDSRELTPQEHAFLDAVAGQLAQALDRARLFEAEARARQAAEQTASQLAFLAEASRIMAASLDLEETLRRLADTVVPRLAEWCVVYLLDLHGRPRHVSTSHVDPERVAQVVELQRRWPVRLDAPAGMGWTLRTGETQVAENVTDELLAAVARDEEHLGILRRVGFSSGMSVPLRIRGQVVGAISAANTGGRKVERRDVDLLEELAARAAVAVMNAKAYAERSAVATGLQATLLPARLVEVPGVEVAARYLAAGEGIDVGGDFYDVFVGHGERLMLAIGDVRGKGVEAAALTGLARHTIRCASLHSSSPRRVLADLNTMLLRADAERIDEASAEPMFCTVCLAAIEPVGDTMTVTVCNAGHPLPLLLGADGSVREVGEPGPVLGVFDEPILGERTVQVRRGEAIVFYTDGITERRDGSSYFEDRLPSVLSGLAGLPADVIAEQLQQAASTFAPDPPTDDMAIVVLRRSDAD
ncbi:MAG TPA: SpoIIE family protein phosphatase [Egibacteraceae bacterium]|nr:SpoIIE family protein phosphatase [Egibacteraceae bacterium]